MLKMYSWLVISIAWFGLITLSQAADDVLVTSDITEVLASKAQSSTQPSLVFHGIAEPTIDEQKRRWNASRQVSINGKVHDIDFSPLMRTGEKKGEFVFGLLTNKQGEALKDPEGNDLICRNQSGPDHMSLLQYEEQLFAISQLECSVGGAYVMKLDQDKQTGQLSVAALKPVDFSKVFVTYVGCAGMTSPWGTHLGSEEYETPMGAMDEDGTFASWSSGWHEKRMIAIAQYHGIERTPEVSRHIGYYHGWVPEISIISTDGDTQVVKHYAMGRFAHELAYVMPDEKTVYLSDDGTRTGLFMFIADQARDLSAGTLYAAKWVQENNQGAGSASLFWINLGHATNQEIEAKLHDMSFTFDSLWKKADRQPNGQCPTAFASVNSGDEGAMCIQLRPGQSKYASRLETRLYAAYRGATTEFNKEEGITYNPDQRQLYIAMSQIEKGMEDFRVEGQAASPDTPGNAQYDFGGNNDIRLTNNMCGAVYALDIMEGQIDIDGKRIDSGFVVGNMYQELVGQAVDYSGTPLAGNACNVNAIAMPDNITYLPKYGILMVGEDTKDNQVDKIWAYDVNSKKLTRVFSAPYGAEVTSPFWHTNINGFGYMTVVVQHPYGETDKDKAMSIDDTESYVGYMGPFPALD